jgi:hypothetical protein
MIFNAYFFSDVTLPNLIERIEAIQTLDSEAQKNVFALLDAFLRDYRTKQAYK